MRPANPTLVHTLQILAAANHNLPLQWAQADTDPQFKFIPPPISVTTLASLCLYLSLLRQLTYYLSLITRQRKIASLSQLHYAYHEAPNKQ